MPHSGFELRLSDEDFSDFLEAGKWSDTADDNITGEVITREMASRIVARFNASPTSAEAAQGLGLLALLLGVAEWGIRGENLPDDPANKGWRSDTGEDSGKHLMSYAVGGVGISHADVGDLEEFVRWLGSSGAIPSKHLKGWLELAGKKYGREGIVYDEIRAAGRCGDPDPVDLLGEPFRHFDGPAGARYCKDYENAQLKERDWQVFRTWTRASLRTRDGQQFLLKMWLRDYWEPTVRQVPPGEGAPEEMLVNVRIRNSAPAVARSAPTRHPPRSGVAGRVQRELDAYADWKLKTARRRWRIMMRPVALYRHLSGLDPLTGVGL